MKKVESLEFVEAQNVNRKSLDTSHYGIGLKDQLTLSAQLFKDKSKRLATVG